MTTDSNDIGKELAKAIRAELKSDPFVLSDRAMELLDRLDPPESKLPDVQWFDATTKNGYRYRCHTVDGDKLATGYRYSESGAWYAANFLVDDLDDIIPLHPDADELWATVDQLTAALRQSTQSRLDDAAKHAAERDKLQNQLNAAHVNIRELQNNVVGRLKEAKELEQKLAARPPEDRKLMADVETAIRRIAEWRDAISVGAEFCGVNFRELLARVRQASDPKHPKPPMPTTLVERCIRDLGDWLSTYQNDVDEDAGEITRQLIADLQRYSDPVPGVTREQSERLRKAYRQLDDNEFNAVLRELGERPASEDPHPQYTRDTGFSPECEV